MRRLALVALALAALAVADGCKKKSATSSSAQQPAGESQHEKLLKDSLANMNETIAVLESVRDEATGRAALPKLRNLRNDAAEISRRMDAMPDPGPDEERLLAKYQTQIDDAMKRSRAAALSAAQLGGPDFARELQGLRPTK